MQHNFGSKAVEDLFRKAGWYEGRKVDPDQLATWFKEAREGYGCHPFRIAMEFLEEFGGLRVGQEGSSEQLIFDPLRTTAIGEPEQWHYWEWETKDVIFPLGSSEDHAVLLGLGCSGALHCGGISEWYMGANIFDGIANYFGLPSSSGGRRLIIEKFDEDDYRHYQALSGLAFPEDFP